MRFKKAPHKIKKQGHKEHQPNRNAPVNHKSSMKLPVHPDLTFSEKRSKTDNQIENHQIDEEQDHDDKNEDADQMEQLMNPNEMD